MRKSYQLVIALATGCLFSLAAIVKLSWVAINDQDHNFRIWAKNLVNLNAALDPLVVRMQQKADFYISQIHDDHLLDGMVVNLDIVDGPVDYCDSLLFTSLYFVGLKKLGYQDLAESIWRAIEHSNDQGRWLRHPRCKTATSRDMIVGLLIALSQNPVGAREQLISTLEFVNKNNGYFGEGTMDVSYLSPGVANFFHTFKLVYQIDEKLFKDFPVGFSTSEYSTMAVTPGYESHLIALQVWLELELIPLVTNSLTSHQSAPTVKRRVGEHTLEDGKISWITQELLKQNQDNIFFKYLRLKAAHALNANTLGLLIAELVNMSQFPEDHLPENCDRQADYLWQRHSREYFEKDPFCTKTFSGVDFIWLAGLLYEEARRLE